MSAKTIPIGQRFGRLKVIKELPPLNWKSISLCLCDCGTTVIVRNGGLLSRRTQSCGCLHREKFSFLRHGHTKGRKSSRTYNSYNHMIQRCTNPNNAAFPRYGGRGITVCQRWMESFENFLNDMGECPGKMTIDRVDNNGIYEPSNCRWATYSQQARNTRRTKTFTIFGVTGCLKDLSEHFGVNYDLVKARINRLKWSIEDALTK